MAMPRPSTWSHLGPAIPALCTQFRSLHFETQGRNLASLLGYDRSVGIYHRRPISQISFISHCNDSIRYRTFLCPICRAHGFSSDSESAGTNFPVENAYELLGVSQTSSFAEIKASFRRLAKETHPDLADSNNDSSASRRFVQILAAYEILSDSKKRAHYDRYLLSQKKLVEKHTRQGSKLQFYTSHETISKEMEVVEWLKWYRLAISDILSEKRVVVGTGYFDVLERDFYSAIHAAYFGPEIESMELLPECFEAEERSSCETPEVLHIVSGRDLFGMVCLANKNPEISSRNNEKLTSFRSSHSGLCQSLKNASIHTNAEVPYGPQIHESKISSHISDAYRDLELHISRRVVAVASRVPPGCYSDAEVAEDRIHVYLNSDEYTKHINGCGSENYFTSSSAVAQIHIGTIAGLGTSPEEGSCNVYDSRGAKTHVIMKHRTLLVKHMHWYQVGEEVSICECRCTRAKLPPSKFWLFEPRCGFHDVGGWYVETYGKDKKGRTIPSQRLWDGWDDGQHFERRLHPAMYLLALAYRTLDLEYAKVRKQTFRKAVEGHLFRILHWCKRLG
ncbi:uncharacterized protein LOC114722366 [Neltuma alba]|uniref:uncharacterized protein LOC114722366 n=1 Tax=Neltuma alba TaxID=207710 RepID=UPI0010A39DD1|nr:uncharacterized protein LOC114722366 [Prosopis alba]